MDAEEKNKLKAQKEGEGNDMVKGVAEPEKKATTKRILIPISNHWTRSESDSDCYIKPLTQFRNPEISPSFHFA